MAHLDGCIACQAERQRLLDLRNAARDLRDDVPFSLALRVRSDARAELDGQLTRALRKWRAAAVAASLVAMASIVWAVLAGRGTSSAGGVGTLADELVSSHVRSLMATHLLDVASSDRHTVKPWFIGKLDFSPEVRDFRDAGFPLIGGRVDYLNQRPVAVLVYQHQKHVINAFTWPAAHATEPASADAALSRQGYHILSWRDGEMRWCLVSDASESALQDVRRLIQDHATPTTSPASRAAN
jgi:anti-sigma factor RsiW